MICASDPAWVTGEPMPKSSPLTSAVWAASPERPAQLANSALAALSSGVSAVAGVPVHPAGKSACTSRSFWARATAAGSDPVDAAGADDAVVEGADVVLEDLLLPPPQAARSTGRARAIRRIRVRTARNHTR